MVENKKTNDAIKDIKREIDTYQDTVSALVCLGHILTWDDTTRSFRNGTKRCFGRRMNLVAGNRKNEPDPLTPDLVAVVSERQGVLAEAKASFHGSLKDRERDFKQLANYDMALEGWPTPTGKIDSHDVILLVHYSRKGSTLDLLEKAKKDGLLKPLRKFAAISFTRAPQSDEFLALECFWGEMSDGVLQKRMRPLSVPLEKVRPLNPASLYDANPHPVLLMQLAWDNVFNTLVSPNDYLEAGKRPYLITCSIDQVRELLARRCAPLSTDTRDPTIPRRELVKDMFWHFENMDLAKCTDQESGSYTVYYSRKSAPLDFFAKRYLALKAPKKASSKGKRGRSGKVNSNQEWLFR